MTDLEAYVLAAHRDLLRPEEEAALGLLPMKAKAKRHPDLNARYREAIDRAPGGTHPLLELDLPSLRHRLAGRLIAEHPTEIWPNRCPRCDALCRTQSARQCPECAFAWHATPRLAWSIARAALSWERRADRAVCRQVPGVGLVVALADGAGNSRSGIAAAEAVIAAVRAHAWGPGTDEWEIQELLLPLDAALAEAGGSGGETTAVVAVFGAETVRVAAAGDSRMLSANAEVPATRTPRLGTGRAAPVAWSGERVSPTYFVTDGAWSGDFAGLARSLAGRLRGEWVQERARESGDDATVIGVG